MLYKLFNEVILTTQRVKNLPEIALSLTILEIKIQDSCQNNDKTNSFTDLKGVDLVPRGPAVAQNCSIS